MRFDALTDLERLVIADLAGKVRLAEIKDWPAVPIYTQSLRTIIRLIELEENALVDLIREGRRRMDEWVTQQAAAEAAKKGENHDG